MMVLQEKQPEISNTVIGYSSQLYNPEDLDFKDLMKVLEHAWEGNPLE
jgi:hypothetical protein